MRAANNIFIRGVGAVSPAGWGVLPLRETLAKGEPLAIKELVRPGWAHPLRVRPVPPPAARPAFLGHARLRRTSPITQFAVAAALEALGADAARVRDGSLLLGIVLCVMTGCVNYSRRFYDETLKDPAMASPILFPETVFNAPASHLAALLESNAINYTLVGDPGTFLQGVAAGANWLLEDRAEACLVLGAEEIDWLTAEAYGLFARKVVLSEGAGAVYLCREIHDQPVVQLHSVTESHLFLPGQNRAQAAQRMRAELPDGNPEHLLCDGTQGLRSLDAAELEVWRDWPGSRSSPKEILGEGLAAASAWQCVAALDALREGQHAGATVSVVGCNQQAIGAHFVISNLKSQISNPSE